jgi:hypothetical protein
MTTSYDPDPQAIVALDIGLGFTKQGQRLARDAMSRLSRNIHTRKLAG